eukprot:Polyplicarium_translucidae@DN2805_c0_g1_i4.p1
MRSYVHRTGRTARGTDSGVAVTVIDSSRPSDRALLKRLEAKTGDGGGVRPLSLEMADVDCFKYRVKDVLRTVSKTAVTQLMMRELQTEALHSKQLESHFHEHPDDAMALRKAAKRLRTRAAHLSHLKDVPAYLAPGPSASTAATAVERAVARALPSAPQRHAKRPGRRADPLRSFADIGSRSRRSIRNARLTREHQLTREPDYNTTAPEELPIIGSRKLWKLRHRKRVTRRTETAKTTRLMRPWRFGRK